jgi:hypothetical protein
LLEFAVFWAGRGYASEVHMTVNRMGSDDQAESHRSLTLVAFRKLFSRDAGDLVIVVVAVMPNPINA